MTTQQISQAFPSARIEGDRVVFAGRELLSDLLYLTFEFGSMGQLVSCYGIDGPAPRKAAQTMLAFCTEGAILYDAATGEWSHEGHLPSAHYWIGLASAFVADVVKN